MAAQVFSASERAHRDTLSPLLRLTPEVSDKHHPLRLLRGMLLLPKQGLFFTWIWNSHHNLGDRHLPWLSGTTWQQQSCDFNGLQVVFTEQSLKNSPRRDHQAEWSHELSLLAGRTERLMSPCGWADKLSDKTPNPISYLSEGTGLWFLAAAPLGALCCGPSHWQPPLLGARDLGHSHAVEEKAQLKTHLEPSPSVKDCWGGQVRERSGSLGSPLEAQLNILVIFLAFSPWKAWWGAHKYI